MKSFVAFVKENLSLPDEGLPAIAAGLKKLTDQDRQDLITYAAAQGINVEQPRIAA